VLFSHGKESGPWGLKIKELAAVAEAAGWAVESLDYRGIEDPQERVDKLVARAKDFDQPVLVGSSMGGAVAARAANSVSARGLFLMATAVYVPGYEHLQPQPENVPTVFVHGWRDSIIPYQNALRFALECKARYVLTDDEHGLAGSIAVLKSQFADFLSLLESRS